MGLTGLMIPRSLRRIAYMPLLDRNAIIAEGLALLTEHIGQLRLGTDHLTAAAQHRAAAILDMIATGEAAKGLILLDLVRLGWKDSHAVIAKYRISARMCHAGYTRDLRRHISAILERPDSLSNGFAKTAI